MELNALQRVAVATALEKELKKITDGRAPGSDRAQVNDAMRALYENDGIDRARVKIGGRAVGTVSASIAPASRETVLQMSDRPAVAEWLRETDEGRDALMELLKDKRALDALMRICVEYGFLPTGCEPRVVESPEYMRGTVVRIDRDKVAAALQGQLLNGFVSGLLPCGGDDDED